MPPEKWIKAVKQERSSEICRLAILLGVGAKSLDFLFLKEANRKKIIRLYTPRNPATR